MRFKGMLPFAEEMPVVEVESNGQVFDLHNAADLDGIEIDARNATLLVRWKLRNPLEAAQVMKRATISILLSHVSDIKLEGTLLTGYADAHELDSLWYEPGLGATGRLRIELIGGAVLHLTADECELRIVGQTT